MKENGNEKRTLSLLPNSVEYYDVVFGKPIKGRIRFSKHSIQFLTDFSSHIT